MWDLADTDKNGFLSPNEFKTALALIALAQQGLQLRDDHPALLRTGRVPVPPPPRLRGLAGLPPAAPPASVQAPSSVAPMPHLAPVGWPPLTADDARRYAAAFAAWDRDRDGRVTGAEIAPFFKQSRCPDPVRCPPCGEIVLACAHACCILLLQSWFKVIWDLADGDADGTLTAPEFAVASYFLDRAAEGRYDFLDATSMKLD